MTDRVSARAAMTRHVSKTGLSLLRRANITPDEIDLAIDALVHTRANAMLRKGHALLRRVEELTGIHVVQIARRSRYLLITIEQQVNGAPFWQYREVSPRRCTFSCRGHIPTTLAVALIGEPLHHLADPMTGMEDLVIGKIDDTADGWLVVDVTPVWSTF